MRGVTNDVQPPRVGVVMGSRSDYATMEGALKVLGELGVPYEVRVLSAHRTPGLLATYAARAERLNLGCVIAGAGGAAHLPGMLAAFTRVPVLGVPVQSRALSGQDSLLSIVQMPAGVPVATFAIGAAGARNAELSRLSGVRSSPRIISRKRGFSEPPPRTVPETQKLGFPFRGHRSVRKVLTMLAQKQAYQTGSQVPASFRAGRDSWLARLAAILHD